MGGLKGRIRHVKVHSLLIAKPISRVGVLWSTKPARHALTGGKGYPVGRRVSSLSLLLNLKTEMRFLTYRSFQNGALDTTGSIHKNSGNTFATISYEILHKSILKCLSYQEYICRNWKIYNSWQVILPHGGLSATFSNSLLKKVYSLLYRKIPGPQVWRQFSIY